jgi:hypothetical protein
MLILGFICSIVTYTIAMYYRQKVLISASLFALIFTVICMYTNPWN